MRSDPLGQQLLKIYTKGKVGSGDIGATAKAMVDATGSSSSSGHTALTRLARAAPIRMRVSLATGKAYPDTRNSSRALKRVLHVDSPLHSPYIAEVWVWDDTTNKKKLDKMAFMPVHEVLVAVVEPGQEATWATCGADQKGLEHDLRRWGDRVGMDTRALADFIPIALWGGGGGLC